MKKSIGFISLLGFIAMTIYFRHLDQVAPSIITFEFSKTAAVAQSAIQTWTAAGVIDNKRLLMYLDFGYIFFYGGLLISALLFFTHKSLTKLLPFLISITVLAGLFDFIENLSLLPFFYDKGNDIFALIAYYAAITKFFFIILVILAICYYAVVGLFNKTAVK